MGKSKKESRDERIEPFRYESPTSISSRSSASSESSNTESESSSSADKRRRHSKKKSKHKRERKRYSDSEEENEYVEREKKKRRKHAKHKETEEDEFSEDEYVRVEERKHRSRKHKHHHRKHKHKHRRHHRHRSEEEYQEKRRGGSLDRDSRREREEWDDRRSSYDKYDRERRPDKDGDRKLRREDKRSRDRGESRQVKSKWDDEEEAQHNLNRRIKPDPDAAEGHEHPRGRQERDRSKKRRRNEEATENGRWGRDEPPRVQNIKQEGDDSEPPREDGDDAQKPNLGLSGKLAEDTNTFNGVVIKYSQPPEARKPKRRWRWYIFKGEEDLPFLPLHRQSAYLIGRDRKVADIPTDHPSCSKQHAVLQYRLVTYEREDGTKGRTVKPYILDLESANGTFVNTRRIEPRRFVELVEKDVVKFGYSSREYILLHEGSKGDDVDMPDTGVDLSPVSLLRN